MVWTDRASSDPLFQRVLVTVIRSSGNLFAPDSPHFRRPEESWAGLPVIMDEVFTGLYRLGHAAPSSTFLRIHSDISAHAKLLTGGLLPLAVTCASESIFEATLSDQKSDALLHGHSYTAHAVGCAVANTSLKQLQDLDDSGKWDSFKANWAETGKPLGSELTSAMKDAMKSLMPRGFPVGTAVQNTEASSTEPLASIWSVWSLAFVTALSHRTDRVAGVWALGSVLSIELKETGGKGGYTSDAARDVQRQLEESPEPRQSWNIHSRTLGNVIYFMASQISTVEHVRAWERRIRAAMGM